MHPHGVVRLSPDLNEEGSRRWNRGRRRLGRDAHLFPSEGGIGGWSTKDDRSSHAKQIKLHRRGLRLRFFLRLLAQLNVLAELAGVVPVEGFRNRFHERSVLRVFDDHCRPRDRLQRAPMRPN